MVKEDLIKFEGFSKHLTSKNLKQLSDLELRKEIILYFGTVSWKKIYETKKTLLALNIIVETRQGFEVL